MSRDAQEDRRAHGRSAGAPRRTCTRCSRSTSRASSAARGEARRELRAGRAQAHLPAVHRQGRASTRCARRRSSTRRVEGDNIVYRKDVNLGIAVALDWGLIVPVVSNADERDLLGLSRGDRRSRRRARAPRSSSPTTCRAARSRSPTPAIFGALFGMPIINQPQVAILGVGAIEKRPVVIDDAIAIRLDAYLTLGLRPPRRRRRGRRPVHGAGQGSRSSSFDPAARVSPRRLRRPSGSGASRYAEARRSSRSALVAGAGSAARSPTRCSCSSTRPSSRSGVRARDATQRPRRRRRARGAGRRAPRDRPRRRRHLSTVPVSSSATRSSTSSRSAATSTATCATSRRC